LDEAAPDRFEHIDRLLAGSRVAAGRSGIAVGSQDGPALHVSWWALAGIGLVALVWMVSRRRHFSGNS
jgi:hypothetical protein